MSDKAWKAEERAVAALFGGRRYAANTGGLVDAETEGYMIQIKHRRTLSLAELTTVAAEMERIGFQKSPPKIGLVVVKHRAGRGTHTPRLIVLTEAAWVELNGPANEATKTESSTH